MIQSILLCLLSTNQNGWSALFLAAWLIVKNQNINYHKTINQHTVKKNFKIVCNSDPAEQKEAGGYNQLPTR
jgi:hypothetical protein